MPHIGQGLKNALLEAFSAAASLLPDAYAEEFVLVGGTALLYLGSTRSTGDVDFLITAQSLNAFEVAARKDSRFSKDSTEQWHYTSRTNGITIPFEFLAAGGGFVSASGLSRLPKLHSLQAWEGSSHRLKNWQS